ncbi:MAG: phage minor head protein, partial [Syntrophales bacterium]|nr:phage minor head protein [Syntrophales bacterium]
MPPEEAIAYFRQKGYRFSWRWHEMWHEDHVKAFTVAKAMRLDILKDIRDELDRAMSEGTTFEEFKKNLTPILQRKGWWGRQVVDGEEVQLGSPRRLATIFNVNIQTAYSVGHYRAMTDPDVLKARPYWRYVAVNDRKTRPQHRAWNDTVLPADHPWWKTHYPPNGWNCRCTVVSLSRREMERDGLKVTHHPDDEMEVKRDPRTGEMRPFPKGIDPGWDYNPGEASVLWDRERADRPMKILTGQKTWKDYGRPDLRDVPDEDRISAPPLLKAGRTKEEAVNILAEAFGLSETRKFIDIDNADGDKAIIHLDLLPHMVAKRQETRERYGLYLLETLKTPYEIWLTDFDDGLRKQYIGLFAGQR